MHTSYPPALKLFHWLTAGLLILQFALIWSAESFGSEETERFIVRLHVSIGLVLMVLTVLRFALRSVLPVPALPGDTAAYERWLARLVQYGFYVLLIALPVIGWAMGNAKGHGVSVFGLLPLPSLTGPDREFAHELSELHEMLATVLLVFTGLHVLAALRHHVLRRDGVLRSMLPGSA